MNRYLASALVAACAATALPVVANTPQWTALIAVDDGGFDPRMVSIVADAETECLAALSSYRDAVVIEPCQPVLEPSAITDPNDASRGRKLGKAEEGKLSGLGHVGGG